MTRSTRLAVLLLALAVPLGAASASPTACPDKFAGGRAPDLLDARLAQRTAPLCFSAFSLLHSGASRTALWSAERLTRDGLRSAREIGRVNSFHAETALPVADRSELSDYLRSGLDRGHLVPSADAHDPRAQEETFSLANMIPQEPGLNRGLWEGIESAVRTLASRSGELYVVTGPIFKGGQIKALKGRVLIPTQIYKAVFDPKSGRAGAYLVDNAVGTTWKAVTIAELSAMTNIDVFPALTPQAKAAGMTLPDPTPHGFDRGGDVAKSGGGGGAGSLLSSSAFWLAKKVVKSW